MEKVKKNKIIITFFVILFFVGIFTFKDYGISFDEQIQREHLFVNYNEYIKIINKVVKIDSIKRAAEYKIIENAKETIKLYPYKYYGVGIQYPIIIIEQITGFKMDISTSFYLKHLYTFLIYFISMIYFYLLLNKFIIKNKKISLIGTMILVMSPRIYGDAFYNIKDLVFMSLSIINYYYCFKYLKSNKLKDIIKLCIITAFTINSRVAGGLIIFTCFIFKLVLNKKNLKKTIYSLLQVFIFTYIFYFVITPGMWYDPIMFPIELVKFFYNYSDPLSKFIQTTYYFGEVVKSTNLPWHYVPVWIIITTPILYIVLFIIGSINNINVIIKKKLEKVNIYLLFTNIILFSTLLFCIIAKPTLYGGWRHLYWLYPLIIINSIVGLKYLFDKFKSSKLAYLIVGILLINQICIAGWMIKNHPYQYNYFNMPIRKYAVNNFEINYYKLANTDAIKYIVEHDKRKNILIKSEYNEAILNLLNKKDRDRIKIAPTIMQENYIDEKQYDYIIYSNTEEDESLKKNYKEIKEKRMDGIRLYTIYKHK